jgi:hypothetical protein
MQCASHDKNLPWAGANQLRAPAALWRGGRSLAKPKMANGSAAMEDVQRAAKIVGREVRLVLV